jgi:hypothetical protein
MAAHWLLVAGPCWSITYQATIGLQAHRSSIFRVRTKRNRVFTFLRLYRPVMSLSDRFELIWRRGVLRGADTYAWSKQLILQEAKKAMLLWDKPFSIQI